MPACIEVGRLQGAAAAYDRMTDERKHCTLTEILPLGIVGDICLLHLRLAAGQPNVGVLLDWQEVLVADLMGLVLAWCSE